MRKIIKKAVSLALTAALCVTAVIAGVFPASAAADYTAAELAKSGKIKIQGRYALSGSDGSLLLENSASGIEFIANCSGDVSVTLKSTRMSYASGGAAKGGIYFTVLVDGVPQHFDERIPTDSNANNWTSNSTAYPYVLTAKDEVKTFTLAEGLEQGEHRFEIYCQSQAKYGAYAVQSVTLDGEIKAAPAENDLYIEFVGDSITAGHGNIANGGTSDENTLYTDATRGWAYLTAKNLGADWSVIAQSGIAATDGVNWAKNPDASVKDWPSIGDVYPKLRFYSDQNTGYDFTRQPDVIVVGLGTNDVWLESYDVYAGYDIKKGFKDTLAMLREYNPNAAIIWIYGMMIDGANDRILAAVNEMGGEEAGLYTLRLPQNRSGGSGHPDLAVQETYAETVSGYIESLLAGTSDNPEYPTGEIWDGTYADSYAGGSGTAGDPYLIETAEQLARMVGYDVLTNYTGNIENGSADKYYKLTADIYLNDVSSPEWYNNSGLNEWYSSTASRFCGNFDGNGHTIKGLYFAPDAANAGLFPVIAAWNSDLYFKNITIADSYISASSMAGAIASRVYGGNSKTVYFENCYIDNSVIINATSTDSGSAANPYCGGFMGFSSVDGDNTGKTTNYNFTNCASLASKPDGSALKYGLAGVNLTWYAELYFTLNNTFAYCEGWQGVTQKATINNSYTFTDLAAVTGETAKETMPGLNWGGVWQTNEGSYPTYVKETEVPSKIWDGTVAGSYAEGTGTADDPYIIETPSQLARMIKNDTIDTADSGNKTSFSMGKYYRLASDIYLNDVSDPDWRKNEPNQWYGSSSSCRFGGNLDGDGYTVYGLYYVGNQTCALIPYVNIWYNDVVIKDIIISDAYINTSGGSAAAVVGYAYSNDNRRFTVSGCFADDNVYLTSTNELPYIAGITASVQPFGTAQYNFIGCASLADVSCQLEDGWKRYAGIIGPNSANVNIDNCFAFPVLGITDNAVSISGTGSYAIGTEEELLDLIGDKALEKMPDFDWAGGAFTPVDGDYPRLKAVSERMGDINGDNACDAADLALLRKHLLGMEECFVCDINSDGASDILDLINLKKKAAAYVPASDGYAPAGYSLVWNDEFYGRTINNSKWRTDQTRMWGTEELGCFDDDTVRGVTNGNLVLTAYKNSDLSTYNGDQYITTNSITTENRMSYRYGYLEVRARVPYKEGCWPSLWLRSPNASGNTGTDDYDIEVDIIEPFGYTDKNAVTIHETGKSDDGHHVQAAAYKYTFKDNENLANEYHTYGFLWTADAMIFYVDGAEMVSYTKSELAELGYTGDFDDTVNILFNNHLFTASTPNKIGGENNIIENYEQNLPSEFQIDYVRLYQKADDASVLVIE